MKVAYTVRALRQLGDIYAYIAKDERAGAVHIIRIRHMARHR